VSEFDLINQYFKTLVSPRDDVLLGPGDDCALLSPPPGKVLAVSTDTLISGVHFPASTQPEDIGYKALAVNLSDLAAVGAEPSWITMSISLPEINQQWLQAFHQGLKKMVDHFGVQIVGGDTCKGPLSITVQAHGFVPENVFCRRNTARAGEVICVTGNLGDAALGLLVAQNKLKPESERVKTYLLKQYRAPYPRVAAGIVLRGRATSGIDVSDGLLADLGHISRASNVGALLRWEKIPVSKQAAQVADKKLLMKSALSGGDDYELCFTVKENDLDATTQALETVGIPCIPIGRMTGKPGVRVVDGEKEVKVAEFGFKHFD